MNQEFNAFAFTSVNGFAAPPAQDDTVFKSGQTVQLHSGAIARIVRVRRNFIADVLPPNTFYELTLLIAGVGEVKETYDHRGTVGLPEPSPRDIVYFFDADRNRVPIFRVTAARLFARIASATKWLVYRPEVSRWYKKHMTSYSYGRIAA